MGKGESKDDPKITPLKNNEDLVPDGGWGWVVAGGCYLILATLPAMSLCFSILFSPFLIELGASSTTTAWIYNTHLLLWNLGGPLLSPLIREFGYRALVLVMCISGSLSLTICAFANSTAFLLTIFGLCGLFAGLASKSCYLMVAQYFIKRRGMATAIIMGGMCTGQFVGPPVIRLLQDTFGFRGATLITSALMLHSVIGAIVFHPVEWHMKTPNTDASTKAAQHELQHLKPKANQTAEKTILKDSLVLPPQRNVLRNRRLRQVSECSNMSLHLSSIDLTGYPVIEEVEEVTDSVDGTLQDARDKDKFCVVIGRILQSSITDLKILTSPSALILALGGLLTQNAYLNFMMTMPFMVQTAGYSLQDAAWCVSVSGVTNLVARLSTSALSDYSWFRKRIVYVGGGIIFGLATAAFVWTTDLAWMKVMAGVWGYGVGVNISLYTLVMASVVGKEQLAPMLGAASLLQAVGFLVLGPLIGMVRDMSGSYDVTALVMAGEMALFVVMWSCMPYVIARERRQQQSNQTAPAV